MLLGLPIGEAILGLAIISFLLALFGFIWYDCDKNINGFILLFWLLGLPFTLLYFVGKLLCKPIKFKGR